jgi:hypothetical protein
MISCESRSTATSRTKPDSHSCAGPGALQIDAFLVPGPAESAQRRGRLISATHRARESGPRLQGCQVWTPMLY